MHGSSPRLRGTRVRTGLDYAACQVVLDATGIDIREVMEGLQVMEAAALARG